MKKQKCKYCTKEIEGYTEDHVKQMMFQHVINKHKDKLEIKEIKK